MARLLPIQALRSLGRRRLILSVLICLIIGAAINLGVAWSIVDTPEPWYRVNWDHVYSWNQRANDRWMHVEVYENKHITRCRYGYYRTGCTPAPGWGPENKSLEVVNPPDHVAKMGFACIQRFPGMEATRPPDESHVGISSAERVTAGWPMKAFRHDFYMWTRSARIARIHTTGVAFETPADQWELHAHMLPTVPVFPGFAANTALFTTLPAAFLVFLPTVMRLRRIRKQHCLHCNYDLNGLSESANRCPECGDMIRTT